LKVGDFSAKMPKLGETWVKLDESWVVLGWFFWAILRASLP
jgi:hypothetical protein